MLEGGGTKVQVWFLSRACNSAS